MLEMTPTPAIELENVSVRFADKTVLNRFSLSIQPGQKVTLTGRSGSGKTTLLRCILGFVVPREGVIRIFGEPMTPETVWTLRTRMAYVAQEPDLGAGSVREILERPFQYRANRPFRKNLEKASTLLTDFMLGPDLILQPITALSGGEKQRVAIISSILLGRSIFLLDEATSALDRVSKQAVLDYFRARPDLTVLSVSHDTESFNDRVIEFSAPEALAHD